MSERSSEDDIVFSRANIRRVTIEEDVITRVSVLVVNMSLHAFPDARRYNTRRLNICWLDCQIRDSAHSDIVHLAIL